MTPNSNMKFNHKLRDSLGGFDASPYKVIGAMRFKDSRRVTGLVLKRHYSQAAKLDLLVIETVFDHASTRPASGHSPA